MTSLTERQLDALREAANVGCGHAATALSQMLGGRRVEIDVPEAHLAGPGSLLEKLGGADAPIVAVGFEMRGSATGLLQLALPEPSARQLAGLLLGAELPPGPLSPDAESAIAETGNILASAYLSALGTLAKLTLLPSIPRLQQGAAGALVGPQPPGDSLLLETRFSGRAGPREPELKILFGHFLVVPGRDSVAQLLRALGLD